MALQTPKREWAVQAEQAGKAEIGVWVMVCVWVCVWEGEQSGDAQQAFRGLGQLFILGFRLFVFLLLFLTVQMPSRTTTSTKASHE